MMRHLGIITVLIAAFGVPIAVANPIDQTTYPDQLHDGRWTSSHLRVVHMGPRYIQLHELYRNLGRVPFRSHEFRQRPFHSWSGCAVVQRRIE
jgi:hypothetical protein